MLDREICLLLVDQLRELRPKVAVEFGSGFSTSLIALYSDELISLKPFPQVGRSVAVCAYL